MSLLHDPVLPRCLPLSFSFIACPTGLLSVGELLHNSVVSDACCPPHTRAVGGWCGGGGDNSNNAVGPAEVSIVPDKLKTVKRRRN